ncbi:MAG: hypothetical protein ABIL09_05310 [Gemmatimonadota bacterium]
MTATLLGLPPRLHSRHVHWSVARTWRRNAYVACLAATRVPDMARDGGRVSIELTRVRTSGPPMDPDNAAESLAHVRDGICDALWRHCAQHEDARRRSGAPCGHLHDDDQRLSWLVRQETGPVALVRITMVEEVP